jgi:hypothetical protein
MLVKMTSLSKFWHRVRKLRCKRTNRWSVIAITLTMIRFKIVYALLQCDNTVIFSVVGGLILIFEHFRFGFIVACHTMFVLYSCFCVLFILRRCTNYDINVVLNSFTIPLNNFLKFNYSRMRAYWNYKKIIFLKWNIKN